MPVNITFANSHSVKTMDVVLSLDLVTFAIVLLDGQEITVKKETTVWLIPVSIMVHAQI